MRAQVAERERRGGVAGDHDKIGRHLRDGVADHLAHAFNQRVFRLAAVRKAGIVRHIDEVRIGPRARDLAEDGETAQAGVEDQNGGGFGGHR